MIRVRTIFLLLFAAMACTGCDDLFDPTKLASSPAIPEEFQGDWTFDEAATLAQWKKTMPPADFKLATEMQELVRSKTGRPLHTDLNITGSVLTGRNAAVLPVYRIAEWHKDASIIRADSYVWEDGKDKHNFAYATIKLQTQNGGKILWLDVSEHTQMVATEDSEEEDEESEETPGIPQEKTGTPQSTSSPPLTEPPGMRFIFTRFGPPQATH